MKFSDHALHVCLCACVRKYSKDLGLGFVVISEKLRFRVCSDIVSFFSWGERRCKHKTTFNKGNSIWVRRSVFSDNVHFHLIKFSYCILFSWAGRVLHMHFRKLMLTRSFCGCLCVKRQFSFTCGHWLAFIWRRAISLLFLCIVQVSLCLLRTWRQRRGGRSANAWTVTTCCRSGSWP